MSELVLDREEILAEQQDAFVASHLGQLICSVYPKRNWMVVSDVRQGVAMIKLADISTEFSRVIHINTTTQLETERKAVMAAGEILERFQLSRSRHTTGDDIHDLKRNPLTGEVIGVETGELQR